MNQPQHLAHADNFFHIHVGSLQLSCSNNALEQFATRGKDGLHARKPQTELTVLALGMMLIVKNLLRQVAERIVDSEVFASDLTRKHFIERCKMRS